MQEFIRSRINAYRDIYEPTHTPLTPTPRDIYCDIYEGKVAQIKPIESCPYEAKYQWVDIDSTSTPCCSSTTDCNFTSFRGYQSPSHNFTMVISKFKEQWHAEGLNNYDSWVSHYRNRILQNSLYGFHDYARAQ